MVSLFLLISSTSQRYGFPGLKPTHRDIKLLRLQEPDFEGDRIVVREGEEVQKKSWFSLKKKSAPPTPKVSRPPSSATFGQHRKSSSSINTDDDDLPPREDSKDSTPLAAEQIPIPPTPVTEQGDVGSATNIPLHAGFDFNAIKEVLGKADLNPDELQIPATSKVTVPHIPPPSHRSESVPLPEAESPASTPRVRSSLDLPNVNDHTISIADPSTSDEFTSSFSRSLSLNNLRDERESDMTSFSGRTPTVASYTQPVPSLSFGSPDGTVWPSQTTSSYESNPFSGFSDRSLYNGSSTALRSENPFSLGGGSMTGLNVSSPLSGNPFAPIEGASLSFGGVDGSITATPTSRLDRDPWDVPSPMFGKKSASTLNLNPWES